MKLILKIIIFLEIVFFLQNLYFSSFPNIITTPTNQIDAAIKDKAEVVILGDSVMITPYSQDTDRRSVSTMLQEKIQDIRLDAIDSLAYSSDVFLEQARYLTRSSFKPKLVIIPVNLRSFSPHWDKRPGFQFELDKLTLKYKNTPVLPYIRTLINLNYFNLIPISEKQFLNTPIFSKDSQIGIMKDFEYPESEKYSDEHQKNKILLSYTYTLSNNHRKLKALEEISDLLYKNNIKVIFYLTPLDYETCEKYTGNYTADQIRQNINLIKNSLNKNPLTILDLTFKLRSNNFAWKDALYINEHLNQNGRQFLANELAKSITENLKKE